MSTTSTTKPTIDAFQKHMEQCPRCRKAIDDSIKMTPPTGLTYEDAKKPMDFCDQGRSIWRSIFN